MIDFCEDFQVNGHFSVFHEISGIFRTFPQPPGDTPKILILRVSPKIIQIMVKHVHYSNRRVSRFRLASLIISMFLAHFAPSMRTTLIYDITGGVGDF